MYPLLTFVNSVVTSCIGKTFDTGIAIVLLTSMVPCTQLENFVLREVIAMLTEERLEESLCHICAFTSFLLSTSNKCHS